MKIFIQTLLILIVTISLNSKDLTNRYKQMMNETHLQVQTKITSTQLSEGERYPKVSKHSMVDEIKKLQVLKQDTFESTSEFNVRRDKVILELQNKVRFFAQNASKEYSAGTAQMKDYHADNEKMDLILKWNDDLKQIFPEIKGLQTVSLDISRKEAKELFSDENTHFFHINTGYKNNKLGIARVSLYDKYEFDKNMPKSKKRKNRQIYQKDTNNKKSNAYELSSSFFGMHGSHNGKAMFELSAQFDSESCFVNVNVKKLSNLGFGSHCKFITSQQNEKLVCLKNMNRCIKHKDLRSIVLQSLNEGNWYVSNVRSDDTLSVRNGPGVKYRKISTLPYNANHLTVLFAQMNGKSSWYKIKYNQIVGWVNSRFLNHSD